jgi:hypothetical protein
LHNRAIKALFGKMEKLEAVGFSPQPDGELKFAAAR